MTEEEAKTKWCPQFGSAHEPGRCIGSECMAWRWGAQHTTIRNDVDPPEFTTVCEGWCGLAGHPDAVFVVKP